MFLAEFCGMSPKLVYPSGYPPTQTDIVSGSSVRVILEYI